MIVWDSCTIKTVHFVFISLEWPFSKKRVFFWWRCILIHAAENVKSRTEQRKPFKGDARKYFEFFFYCCCWWRRYFCCDVILLLVVLFLFSSFLFVSHTINQYLTVIFCFQHSFWLVCFVFRFSFFRYGRYVSREWKKYLYIR